MFDGVSQHPIIKQFTITYANTRKQSSKIKLTYVPMLQENRRVLDCEQLRIKSKNKQVPSHDLHLNQAVMYQDCKDKRWYPATITRLCQEPRSYLITTNQGVQYSKTQAHLKPYHPQDKDEDELCNQEKHKQTAQGDQNQLTDTNLVQSRPKRDIKPPNRLDL